MGETADLTLSNQSDMKLSSRTMRCLNELIASGASRDQDLHLLTQSMETLSVSMKKIELSSEAMKQLQSLLERSDQAVNTTLQHKVLKYLETDKLTDRFDEVDNAHSKTYSWLFTNEDEETPRNEHLSFTPYREYEARASSFKRREVKKILTTWLLEGHGIFHISGKPGAGKSTLMKLLCDHPRTEEYLKNWAAGSKLIIAKFFFWKLGTKIQKSIKGLERGLLHSVLSQNSELLRVLFPQQCVAIRQHNSVHISNEDVEKAFNTLVNTGSATGSYKFMFFIDGLDELEGDHAILIRQLFKWTSLHADNLKICVSSREWLVFQERLSGCPRVRLHEITYKDISSFIEGELEKHEDFISSTCQEEIQTLAYSIVDKAEGVFLWAKIALQNLQQGLLVEDRIEDLRKRVDELPCELEDLYQSIFESILKKSSRSDRLKAMKTLHLLQKWESLYAGIGLLECSLFVYSFLDEYDNDPDWAMKCPLQKLGEEQLSGRLRRARKQISTRCLGLVESHCELQTGAALYPNYKGEVIRFVHSSIYDYLNQDHTRSVLESATCEFEWTDFWLQGSIAAAMSFSPDDENCELEMCIESMVQLAMRSPLSGVTRASQSLHAFANIIYQHGLFPVMSSYNFCMSTGGQCGRKDFYSPAEAVSFVAAWQGWYHFFLRDDNPFLCENTDMLHPLLVEALLGALLWGVPSWHNFYHSTPMEEQLKALMALEDCLEHHVAPNVRMACCERAPLWHAYISSALDAYTDTALVEPSIRLFLLYGADSSLQFRLQSVRHPRNGNGYRLTVRSLADDSEIEKDGLFSAGPLFELCQKHDGVVDFRQLVELWFPGRRSKILQMLIDRNLRRGGPPPSTEVNELKADRSLDLNVREGLTFENYGAVLIF